jgi:hypothetical protein
VTNDEAVDLVDEKLQGLQHIEDDPSGASGVSCCVRCGVMVWNLEQAFTSAGRLPCPGRHAE